MLKASLIALVISSVCGYRISDIKTLLRATEAESSFHAGQCVIINSLSQGWVGGRIHHISGDGIFVNYPGSGCETSTTCSKIASELQEAASCTWGSLMESEAESRSFDVATLIPCWCSLDEQRKMLPRILQMLAILLAFHAVVCVLLCHAVVGVPTPQSGRQEFPYISGLRFLASTHIMISHFYACPVTMDRFAKVVTTFFIVMSGFMSQVAYGRKSMPLKVLYLKRIGRILFVYYLAVGLSAIGKGMPQAMELALSQSWAPAFGIPLGAFVVNGSLWTLSSLVYCWLAHPFLAWLLIYLRGRTEGAETYCIKLYRTWVTVLGLMCASFWVFKANTTFRTLFYRESPLSVMVAFTSGALVAEVVIELKDAAKSWIWGLVVDAAFFFCLLACVFQPAAGLNDYRTVAAGDAFFVLPLCALLLAAPMASRSLLLSIASHDLCNKLGSYSFHVFALHRPVQMLVSELVGNPGVFKNLTACASGIATLLTYGLCVIVADVLEPQYLKALQMVVSRIQDPSSECSTRTPQQSGCLAKKFDSGGEGSADSGGECSTDSGSEHSTSTGSTDTP